MLTPERCNGGIHRELWQNVTWDHSSSLDKQSCTTRLGIFVAVAVAVTVAVVVVSVWQ